jgi:hypothetical protein
MIYKPSGLQICITAATLGLLASPYRRTRHLSLYIMAEVNSYKEWVTIELYLAQGEDLTINNLQVFWGKLHKIGLLQCHLLSINLPNSYLCPGNKDDEISVSTVEGHRLKDGDRYTIASCGRSGAASGTEGSFDLVNNARDVVAHIYWSCPWGASGNEFKAYSKQEEWLVSASPVSPDSALGDIKVKLYETA